MYRTELKRPQPDYHSIWYNEWQVDSIKLKRVTGCVRVKRLNVCVISAKDNVYMYSLSTAGVA